MEENEILELYHLPYADLMALSSHQIPTSNNENEIQRLASVSISIMQSLGRNGPGLLSITGVPAPQTSQTLLPLARKLALLSNDDRKRILKDHNLGSDVPLKNLNRTVSSFAMQMKYDDEFNFGFGGSAMDKEVEFGEFKDLGFAFRELGLCMMELGLCLARVCDQQIGGCELEQSLLQSGTAKGRLIHYHSVADNAAINEAENRRRRSRVNLGENRKSDCGGDDGNSRLWQQWHYDYGIFAILTTPMFMLSNGSDERECDSPSGHTYLQVFHPEMNRVVMVKAPRGSFIVQVGESADVLSGGRLRATLHSVSRPPAKMENLSRETFVIFLQPAWSKTFSLANYPEELLRLGGQGSELCDEETCSARHESNGLARKIQEIVPPLSSRLRDGMTFVEFAKETTKQYYGGKGLQANR